jgi:uncharacterized membrane protein YdfJ with MMPL/SSD domain
VLFAWSATIVGVLPLALHRSDHLISGGFLTAGSQSATVDTIAKREFPHLGRSSLAILLAPRSWATGAMLAAEITEVVQIVQDVRGVSLPKNIVRLAQFNTGLRETTLLPLEVNLNETETQQVAERLRRELGVSNDHRRPIEVHLLGERAFAASLYDESKRQLAKAETIGFPILLLVLLAIFGSMSAALVPIALAATALIVTGALIYLVSLGMQLSTFITNTASLIGIGVAVDYSLLILARFRQEIARGRDTNEAQRIAMRSAGRTVLFSGATVMASLMGLWVIPNTALRSMALGAVMVVAVAVVASLTLLPALIGTLGARRLSGQTLFERIRKRGRPAHQGAVRNTWTQLVMRHPARMIAIGGGCLLLLCIPALDMSTASGPLSQLSPRSETRIGYEEASRLVGPGSLEPIDIAMHWSGSESRSRADEEITKARGIVARHRYVLHVSGAHVSKDGRYAFFEAVPAIDPESETAKRLVEGLRKSLADGVGHGVALGGATAVLLDEERAVAASMWKVIAAVLVMAFIFLLLVVRSVVLPFKAVAMNLLSVGCAYGVLVIVFQWGWLDKITGYTAAGHLNTLTPPLILAIVFGLSMDYEVFLLSRIREHWTSTNNASDAIRVGVSASAKTISSAALILMCVFAIFIGTGLPSIKEVGLGAAVAIGVDATVIRLTIVPAIMMLLGDTSWWVPQRIARVTSSVSFRRRALPDRADCSRI